MEKDFSKFVRMVRNDFEYEISCFRTCMEYNNTAQANVELGRMVGILRTLFKLNMCVDSVDVKAFYEEVWRGIAHFLEVYDSRCEINEIEAKKDV